VFLLCGKESRTGCESQNSKLAPPATASQRFPSQQWISIGLLCHCDNKRKTVSNLVIFLGPPTLRTISRGPGIPAADNQYVCPLDHFHASPDRPKRVAKTTTTAEHKIRHRNGRLFWEATTNPSARRRVGPKMECAASATGLGDDTETPLPPPFPGRGRRGYWGVSAIPGGGDGCA
jgi:hypothetical protein